MSMFWFGSASNNVYKTVKNSNSSVEEVSQRYFLIMTTSIDELTMTQDNLIYLLQCLDFLINLKQPVLLPSQTLEFLGVEINSKDMILRLPKEKENKIVEQCQFALSKPSIAIKVDSGCRSFGISSHCSSSSTSTLSCYSASADNGVFQREITIPK